jgi:lysophospholipase L1-like esterase
MMSPRIHTNSKLVMIGDSITDCGRAYPVGEGTTGGLGNGYVALVDALLNTVYPQEHIRIVNMGISGNTVRDLRERWRSDVLDLQPDWLSIMIGINDVWRQFDARLQTERHISLDEYERTLTDLVAATRPRLKGLVLMTPYFIEPNRSDPMRARMDRYGRAVQQIAAQHDALFVDTQAAFDAVLEDVHAMTLAHDRVHPGLAGHMVLARAFLNTIGFAW